MSEINDNLEDLEATNADEVTGGGKPLLDVQVGGQRVTADVSQNRQGGYDVSAGGAGISAGENQRTGRYEVEGAGLEASAGQDGASADLDAAGTRADINP